MVTRKIVFLLFVLGLVSTAQNNEYVVEYNYVNNFYENSEYLIIQNQNAVYYKPSLNKTFDTADYIENADGSFTIPLKEMDIKATYVFYDKTIDVLSEHMYDSKGNKFHVVDETYSIDWEIHKGQTKAISGFNCTKATTSFRGRDYIVYFTTEVPINFGPFKFHGLPGLVVSINNLESDNGHSWILKRIDKLDNFDSLEIPIVNSHNLKKITRFELYKLDYRNYQERLRVSNARLPEGTKMVSSTIENLGIEKIYEWELEESEKD